MLFTGTSHAQCPYHLFFYLLKHYEQRRWMRHRGKETFASAMLCVPAPMSSPPTLAPASRAVMFICFFGYHSKK
jgi:hypothetical protein